MRFFTSYDYRVRFGAPGRLFDAVVFRPLMGWATAWSFDRLRLWIEKGIDPALSRQRTLIHVVARSALGFVWLYQGLIPKLLAQHADELAMIQQGGISVAAAPLTLMVIGWSEVLMGLAMLVLIHHRWLFHLTIFLMIGATVSVAINSSQLLIAAFNPVSLNVLMIGMAVVGLLTSRDIPSAQRCLRKPPEGGT